MVSGPHLTDDLKGLSVHGCLVACPGRAVAPCVTWLRCSKTDASQDARKGILFEEFPPVLQLQLKRFEYDCQRDAMIKVGPHCACGRQWTGSREAREPTSLATGRVK